jgi:hypothetical protein
VERRPFHIVKDLSNAPAKGEFGRYDGKVGKPISRMNSAELLELVRGDELDERQALDVLRNSYCTVEIAEIVADSSHLLRSHVVREVLSGIRGFPFARTMTLLATLPWTSLLNLAQSPSAPPVVRRHAEKKLLGNLPRMSLGEKVALARRAHRPLFGMLISSADVQVLVALLNNPRLVENDILVILNTASAAPEFFATLAKHQKWGHYYGVRRGLAECPRTPLPIALSALVQLRRVDLEQVCAQEGLSDQVRTAARGLLEKEQQGLRRVVRSTLNDREDLPSDSTDGIR